MNDRLIKELVDISKRCAPKDSKFIREPDKARERLVLLIRYAKEHLETEIKLPSVKETKRTLNQIDAAINGLIIKLGRLPADEITAFYQLEGRNWGHIRSLPLAIWIQMDQLKSLQATLREINTSLDGNKNKNRDHNVHDIVVACINFFIEYIGEDKITTSSTSCFSKFVQTLFNDLGHYSGAAKIIRAEVNKTKEINSRIIIRRQSTQSKQEQADSTESDEN